MTKRSFLTIKDPRPRKWLRTILGSLAAQRRARVTVSTDCFGGMCRLPPRNADPVPHQSKTSLPSFSFRHSSCLANYLGQWVPSASRVLCPGWDRGILCGERILLRLHMRRGPLQACILIPFLCKGPAGGEWEEGKPQNSLGHPFVPHTLKPRWKRLKAEGAKSHLHTPGSPWVWTGKQGELHGGISTRNEK